jgi:AraC-like DNA-binding protein
MSKLTRIDQAIRYIKRNWRNGKSLKQIAEIHGFDPGNLARSFRNSEGVTVKAFVNRRRKEYVTEQLGNESPFGYEIGRSLGFADDLAFYRWVKRAFGVSFEELRKRSRRMNSQKVPGSSQ